MAAVTEIIALGSGRVFRRSGIYDMRTDNRFPTPWLVIYLPSNAYVECKSRTEARRVYRQLKESFIAPIPAA